MSRYLAQRVLVTGATGFIGLAVSNRLKKDGCLVYRLSRWPQSDQSFNTINLADIVQEPEFLANKVDAVIHLAGLAHRPISKVAKEQLEDANIILTKYLAQSACSSGVPLIFMSSAKVLGEEGTFTDKSLPRPADPYAQSKWDAEKIIISTNGLRYTILRPPLIFGPGVKGNFLALLKLVKSGYPLPFGLCKNQRSMLFIDDCINAITTCLNVDTKNSSTYLIGDQAHTLTDIVQRLASAMGKPDRQLKIPPKTLTLIGRWFGKEDTMRRITGEFIVQPELIHKELGWSPSVGFNDALLATVSWYSAKVS